ncbi:MAG: sulfatase-like hydrolase/transferase [Acidobacteriota bacterium]
MRHAILLLSVLALLPHLAAAETEETPPPNIVLITLDTVRADHLGAAGYQDARTPNLDALARRGTYFERCDTAAPITLPSHASLFTGLLPPRHGVRDNGTFTLGDEYQTLAETLSEAGYDTGAAIAAVVLAKRYGMAQGFRRWNEELTPKSPGLAAEERDAEAVTDAALKILGDLTKPYFLWVHYYDPHEDYRPPERLLERQQGAHRAYDAEIAYVDEQIGRLLTGLPGNTVVTAVADHGEMLGDYGEATHGVLLHHGARRVPLIMAGPGIAPGRRVTDLVRTIDLAPTLLEIAAVEAEPKEPIDGESLLPLISREAAAKGSRVSYSESFLPLFSYRWYPLRALSDGRWLFVDAPTPRLFDLRRDPAEERDLAAEKTTVLAKWRERFRERLVDWGELDDLPEAEAVSSEERRALAALGYLSGSGSAESLTGLPDPYDLVDIVARLLELGDAVSQNRCGEAFGELRRILRRSRENLPALNMAGICLMGEGKYAEALPYFEQAVSVHPDSTIARANLAGCLLRLDRRAEAEAAYRETLKRDAGVPQAVANLARLLREKGDLSGALQVMSKGFAAGGEHGRWYLERGLIQAAAGRVAPAFEDFERAVELEPTHREALENAALAAYRLRRPARAATLYRRLAEVSPGNSAPWKTLGAIQLYELADPAAARSSFERALALERDPAQRAELEALLAELGT